MTDSQPRHRAPGVNARNVAIIVFDDVQVLDFSGPLEVFSTAAAEVPRTPARPYAPYFVRLVGLDRRPVRTTGGMVVTPDSTFRDCPAPDLLIVPGGPGSRALLTHGEFLN
jgi:putative intracellular protease/amidase